MEISGGFEWAVVGTAFVFGLRHGVDWDHIAAITDITASQTSPRRGFFLATLYALGHAAVVLVLGVVAIQVGGFLPEGADRVMERVVGVTLLALGVYVFYSLIRHGRDFRMRSRWMLVFMAVRRAFLWLMLKIRGRPHRAEIEHDHPHPAGAPPHDHDEDQGGSVHAHHHRHRSQVEDAPFLDYGRGSSMLVGAIHGVGAETPTQVVLFVAATGAGSRSFGLLLLGVFLVGLVATNSLVALGSAFGMLQAGRNFPVFAGVAVVTGTFSLVVGAAFVLGVGESLPALL
jgi:ABC-type nickel/cobalt efflux system permease component RcnA